VNALLIRSRLRWSGGAADNLPMKQTTAMLFAALLLAIAAHAADISGNWNATAEGPQGAIERTFTFNVSGATLTGETSSSFLGKSEIKDGKIQGDKVTFHIVANFQGTERKINYNGTTGADSFTLTSTMEGASDFPPIQWKLTRAK
jgi:hypothetical protein